MNLKGRKFVSGLCVTAMAVSLLVGCGTSAKKEEVSQTTEAASEKKDSGLTTVRINQAFQSLLYLPLYVADDAGFFEEEGIKMEKSTAGGGPQSWSAVLGGSADFALGDPVYVPMSRYEGGSGVVFASIQNAATVWIVGNEDVDLSNNLDALKGKTIITGAEPDTDWALFQYLKNYYNDDGSEFTETTTAIGSQIAPLLAGEADFATSCEPVVSEGISQGLSEVFSFAEFDDLYPLAFSCLMTSDEFVDENPETAQGVMNAIEKACQYIYNNTDEAIEIAKKEFPDTDEKVVEDAVNRMIECKGYPEHALVTEEAWANNMKLAQISGNIKEYPADYSDYETNVEIDMAKKAQEQ